MDQDTDNNLYFHPYYNGKDNRNGTDTDLVIFGTSISYSRSGRKQKKRTHFRVHSLLLKTSSGFFRQMLEIPRSEEENANHPIELAESSTIIEFMLDGIYPIERAPVVDDWETVWAIVAAADKYDIQRVVHALQRSVMAGELRNDALQLYVLACRFNWADIKTFALENTMTKEISFSQNLETLSKLNSQDMLQLLCRHQSLWESIQSQLLPYEALEEAYAESVDYNEENASDSDVYWRCKCEAKKVDIGASNDFYRRLRYYVRGYLALHPGKNATRGEGYMALQDVIFFARDLVCVKCGTGLETPEGIKQRLSALL